MSSAGQAQRLPLNSIFPTTMLANNSNIQRTAVNSDSQNLKCKWQFKTKGWRLSLDKALTDTEGQIEGLTHCLLSLQSGSPFLFIL